MKFEGYEVDSECEICYFYTIRLTMGKLIDQRCATCGYALKYHLFDHPHPINSKQIACTAFRDCFHQLIM